MKVEIICQEPLWEEISLNHLFSRTAAQVINHTLKSDAKYLISVLACDDKTIMKLNETFRGKKEPTNVLSWPTYFLLPNFIKPLDPFPAEKSKSDGIIELGDIAISYQRCLQEAKELKKEFSHHLIHLITHSCLHLLGYKHDTIVDTKIMEAIEIKILATNGLESPYSEPLKEKRI